MDEFLTSHVYSLAHWPFMAWAIIAAAIGQVMKTSVWTKARAYRRYVDQAPGAGPYRKGAPREKVKAQWLWWWGWKTLPLHPIASGFLIGLAWSNPETADPAWAIPAASFYFAVAGAVSVSLYQVVKGLAKKKGVTLGPLPGESTSPPPPET